MSPMDGEVAESAEGNRLLSGCTGKTVPRVRIPPSPPLYLMTEVGGFEPEHGRPVSHMKQLLERCPSWPKERDWKSRRRLIPASRVRIPPSPPCII